MAGLSSSRRTAWTVNLAVKLRRESPGPGGRRPLTSRWGPCGYVNLFVQDTEASFHLAPPTLQWGSVPWATLQTS